MRLERLGEAEFTIVMWFDDWDAVRALAVARGIPPEDYERAVVTSRELPFLRRYDRKSTHYQVKATLRH